MSVADSLCSTLTCTGDSGGTLERSDDAEERKGVGAFGGAAAGVEGCGISGGAGRGVGDTLGVLVQVRGVGALVGAGDKCDLEAGDGVTSEPASDVVCFTGVGATSLLCLETRGEELT